MALAIATLFPFFSAGLALLAGIMFSLIRGNPFPEQTRKWTSPLLQFSVVGLGAGMDLAVVARVGMQGVSYTAIGIGFTLAIGLWLGKVIGTERVTSLLSSVGTAICGGSAIAAVAPVIRAKDHEVSVALATVFFLNATALLIFPWIGHWAALDENQFGLLAALAIHDTSSVVGAGMQYGPHALQVATTVKLARALWIIPVAWIIGALWKNPEDAGATKKAGKKPWFILGFLLVAAAVTWIPALRAPGEWVAYGARRSLVLTLFLIGAGLSRDSLKQVGHRPLLQGVVLWIIVSGATLGAILLGWIH